MKSGAGDDPFADVGDESDDEEPEQNESASDDRSQVEETEPDEPTTGNVESGPEEGMSTSERGTTSSSRGRTGTPDPAGRTGPSDSAGRTGSLDSAGREEISGRGGREDVADSEGRKEVPGSPEPDPPDDGRMSVEDLPYIARRNVRGQSVKTGRDKNVLFELRPEIAEREQRFVEELERELGTDVPKTDAREAALAAIWDRPELVVPVLEEWGLGYFED